MDEVVRFGKYRGKTWGDVLAGNENYVRWVLCSAESGSAFQGVDSRWITWAKQLGLMDVLSGMSVTDVARRRARDAMQLPSVARVVWINSRVGEPLPCPAEYSPAEYGTFVDYVVRHHTHEGEFRDGRIDKILAADTLPPAPRAMLVRAYENCVRGHTPDVLADLFVVSKAHDFCFSGRWQETAFRPSQGWLARLSAMLAEALPSGHVVPNPIVGTKLPSGKLVRGDADMLVGDELVELKASMQLSHEYVACQLLLYAALLRMRGIPVHGARVLNVATATLTRADLSAWDHAELMRWLDETLVEW